MIFDVFTLGIYVMENTHLNKLKLLGTFHYVVGGIGLSLLVLIHFGLGIAMLTVAMPMEGAENAPLDPRIFGFLFAAVGGLFFLLGRPWRGLLFILVNYLKSSRSIPFHLSSPASSASFFHSAIVLGVFTIIALQDKDVKAFYPLNQSLDHRSKLLQLIRAELIFYNHAYHICDDHIIRCVLVM